MNRLLISTAALLFALAANMSAMDGKEYPMDQGMMGQGKGMMYGNGHMMGQGMMYGYGPMMGRNYRKSIPEKEAMDILNTFLKEHLKGFKIEKIEKFNMPMGTMYAAQLKDNSGNEFELQMNPWGQIMGLFVK